LSNGIRNPEKKIRRKRAGKQHFKKNPDGVLLLL
jgi:hypothetical protein